MDTIIINQPQGDADVINSFNNVKAIVHAYRGVNYQEHKFLEASMEVLLKLLVAGETATKELAELKTQAEATATELAALKTLLSGQSVSHNDQVTDLRTGPDAEAENVPN